MSVQYSDHRATYGCKQQLGAVYMGAGTGRLPGWDVCRDGTLLGIPACI